MPNSVTRKESAEVRRRLIRKADDLVGCLAVELEVEFALRSAVVPIRERFELAPPQAPLGERGAPDGDAHARRVSSDTTLLGDGGGRGDDTARDETWSTFVLAREDKDRIAGGDTLAAVHGLLRGERERHGPRIAHLSFDGKAHAASSGFGAEPHPHVEQRAQRVRSRGEDVRPPIAVPATASG